ncbi:TM2 domain-containing protein [Acidovorax sp. LjRoot74]|uniref:TM2 domain-containing protein n=1 Tax=Acidovorax sp. LjRoot74 TaxID=3342337 RepID=UPI003ECF229F
MAKHPQPPPDAPLRQSGTQLVKSAKSRGIYIILGLFFGLLGVHNFYAGRLGIGLAQLLITCILGWFVVGLFITAIWVLIELFTVTKDGAGDAFA